MLICNCLTCLTVCITVCLTDGDSGGMVVLGTETKKIFSIHCYIIQRLCWFWYRTQLSMSI